MGRRVGILTGGGDAPGLNAVIRAFVKHGAGALGLDVVGVCDAFNGLIDVPHRTMRLDLPSCRGLLQLGGTILGTTNRGDPFAYGPSRVDRSRDVRAAMDLLDLEGLVCIGGEGSQAIALRLMEERGVPVIGVPKTIDNDLDATDLTFGFQSAVDVATDALDRLHTTAESHDRVMLLEVMGRDAGHIALSAGIAGGADAILLPELPWSPDRVADKILGRRALGRPFSVIVVAEGAVPATIHPGPLEPAARHALLRAHGGAGQMAMQEISRRVDAELRLTVLGHLQRGGSPVPFDRLLATRFGVEAADLAAARSWGRMVRLSGQSVGSVALRDAVARYRGVDPDGELVRVARSVGIELGA
ncbi:MAG TPA: ATP-dependent 6-phosphofructokinase [Myxococcota bacterium]|nr:ATP-dependent 6-phosphofructokinase [Myxococcota bacterium]